MRKSTKDALLIALFSQKPSKEDAPVFYISSLICTSLIIIGGALESKFLFCTGLGLIFLVPMLLGSFRKFIASRGTSRQTIWTIHFFTGAAMGMLFIIGLSASMGELFTFSFLGLLAVVIIEGIIMKYE
ncbi:MAG: hypothetical protein IKP61_02430 [Spirochaetales bacterium]|nr:hypothetical protein [Spirochaetales bacterium]